MDDVAMETLVFTSEEERQKALIDIPDEPPPGVDIEEWQKEQDEKVRKIVEASISEEAAPKTEPKTDEGHPSAKPEQEDKTKQPVEEEDEYVDFSALGKMKKSELPENLRNYRSPQEILKQAAHARRYANSAEDKIRHYEETIAELQSTAGKVPDLQKQLDELKKATEDAKKSVEQKPFISSGKRAEFNTKLDEINARIEKLKDYGGEDVDALQSVMSGTVDVFKDTLAELDSVKDEFTNYRKTAESRYVNLEKSIKSVSEMTQRAEEKRKLEFEQKTAERNLEELQSKFPDLKTTKPLYADDRNDLESAIVRMTERVYGRKPKNFDEINRFVSAFNAKDTELLRICESEGINPGDYGINKDDIRNYGILMNVYWRQRGERIDPLTGSRIPVTDWRGQKVTFPDFASTFQHMKESEGITTAEKELAIIEAEKKGQQNLDASLKKRDTSPPTLEPTGLPPEGQGLTENQALEIIGERKGRMTVDEEKMERLLRIGDKRGWDMFKALQAAHETLGMPIPQPEPYWRNSA
jgi:hypothetical protein